jgi:hypothetical protein
MKKIVLLSFTFATLFANAQKVNVEVGKTFKVTTNSESTMEVMGNENTTKTGIISSIKIVSLDKDFYKGTNTVNRMTMSGSMMGQDINFDSDKKEDMDGQMGQFLGAKVNKSTEFTLDKNTGAYKEVSEKEEDGMASMFGGGDNKNSGIFYTDAIGKKVGDKWTVTNDAEGIKAINNYEVKTINGNVMTVGVVGTVKGTTTKEAQGQSAEITLDTKSTGTLTIEVATGILKQSTMEIEGSTSMDGQGQSMVMANKSKITIVVE